MKPARWFRMAGLAVILAAGVAPASAQVLATKADIAFPFIVNGKMLPAGNYEIQRLSPENLLIRSATDPKNESEVLVITRLAEKPSVVAPELVFDKVGTRNYLSEFWLPGDDGYLVYAAKEAHSHSTIKAVKK